MREVRGKEPRRLSAPRLRIHANTLASYESGRRKPTASLVMTFAEVYGIEPAWLLTGTGPKQRPSQSAQPVLPPPEQGLREPGTGREPEPVVGTPVVTIPLKDNTGRFVAEDMQRTVSFPRALLAPIPVPVERLNAMIVPDRINEPDIGDGDLILIDTSDTDAQQAGFFVFAREGTLLVRWSEPDLRGGYILKGSPAAKSAQIVEPAEVGQVRVLGRVVWRGGAM